MSFLLLQAYLTLIRMESLLKKNDFPALYKMVRNSPVVDPPYRIEMNRICSTVNIACVWYWKQVLCLQRSAALTCLLRKYGIPAHMVIGARLWPFASHAWVEVRGQVVNEKAYIREKFALVLDRC